MDRRTFLKKTAFIFTGSLWIPRVGILRPTREALASIQDMQKAVIAKKNTAGGGPETWYYNGTGKGESDYASTASSANNWCFSDDNAGQGILIVEGGSLTHASVKFGTCVANNLKIAVYNLSDDTLLGWGTNSSPNYSGWNDVAVSVPFAVTTNQRVYVAYGGDDESGYSYDALVNWDIGYEYSTYVYGNAPYTPNLTPDGYNTDKAMGARVYVA